MDANERESLLRENSPLPGGRGWFAAEPGLALCVQQTRGYPQISQIAQRHTTKGHECAPRRANK
jgi:hypothetical protein